MPNFEWIMEYADLLLEGLVTTLELLLISGLFGFLLAVLIATAKQHTGTWMARAAGVYTQVIRGTPLLVQMYLLYYGVGSTFSEFPFIRDSWMWDYLRDGFWYVALALVLSVGGYVGEVILTGLRAVPKGEIECARALGMNRWVVYRRIWVPRAVQLLLPTLSGEAVLLLKSTALASTVATTDLLGAVNYVRAQTLITYEPLLSLALIYMALAWIIERLFNRVERKNVRRKLAEH